MGFFSPDMVDMIEVYQVETIELIDELDQHLIKCEKEKSIDLESVNAIFRVVHTIKSSSAMMGMDDFSQYTHRIEDLFDSFRENPEKIKDKIETVFDLLYGYSDFVKEEVEKISDPDYRPSSVQLLMEKLGEVNSLLQGRESERAYTFRVTFKKEAQMENVRAFLLIKQISSMCSSVSHIPSDLESNEAALAIKNNGLIVNFTSSSKKKIYDHFISSPYVYSVKDMEEAEKSNKEEVIHKVHNFTSISWDKIETIQSITADLITNNTILEDVFSKASENRELEMVYLAYARLLNDLEDVVNEVSLMPISSIAPQLYRIVREISRKEEKSVNFSIKGEETETDKNLIDMISTPLIHLIRNSIDHGIEKKGNVSLTVSNLGSLIEFIVEDDGKGLDAKELLASAERKNLLTKAKEEYSEKEIYDLIFIPGFSTTKVANEFSGRGVGMDAVKAVVDKLSGVIKIENSPGQGLKFIIRVPVSMTSVESLCFTIGNMVFLIPTRDIEFIYSNDKVEKNIKVVDKKLFLNDEGLIPVLDLVKENTSAKGEYLIKLNGIEGKVCITCDDIIGHQKVVEKPLPFIFGNKYKRKTGIIGGAIIGDGRLGYMLSVDKLLAIAMKG